MQTSSRVATAYPRLFTVPVRYTTLYVEDGGQKACRNLSENWSAAKIREVDFSEDLALPAAFHGNFPTAPDAWLCRRLAEHGAPVAPGSEPLQVRVRHAIACAGLEAVIVGRGRDRKPFTYAQALERLYGTSRSDPPRARRAKRAGGLTTLEKSL